MVLKKINTNLIIIKEVSDKKWNLIYRNIIPNIFKKDESPIKIPINELSNHWIDICVFYEKTEKLQNDNLIKIDSEIKNIFNDFLIKYEKQKQNFKKIINDQVKIENINLNYFKKDFIPFDFQEKFTKNIISKKYTGNFSSPGSGKTIISMMAVINLFYSQKINNLLVIGPKSSSIAWYTEGKIVSDKIESVDLNDIDKHPLNFSNQNIELNKKYYFDKNKINIIFINFHKFDNKEIIEKLDFILKNKKIFLIIDEAHNIKNIDSNRFKNILLLSKKDYVKYKLILTGTPLPRATRELLYATKFLFNDFLEKPLSENDFNYESPKDFKTKTKRALRSIFNRYDKEQLVKDGFLKEKKIIIEKIKSNEIYNKLIELTENEDFSFSKLKSFDTLKIIRAFLIRMMQASSYPPLLKQTLDESLNEYKEFIFSDLNDFEKEKIKKKKNINKIIKNIEKEVNSSEIRNMIEKFSNNEIKNYRWIKALKIINKYNNERILVWDIFIKSINDFEVFLKKKTNREIFKINGRVNKFDRIDILSKFKNSLNGVLIASPATIAESISLHNHVDRAIYLFRNYVGAHYFQSIDRIHRIVKKGENSSKKYIHILISDYKNKEKNIDEMINDNLENKNQNQKELFNIIENYSKNKI